MAPRGATRIGAPCRRTIALLALALGLGGCTSLYFREAGVPPPEVPRYALEKWPYSEYWTGIIFNGEKVDYGHVMVVPAADHPGRYEIRSESALHLRMHGFDKRIARASTDRVAEDLTLEWLSHHYDIDGSRLAPSLAAPADDARIQALAREIAHESQTPRARVETLLAWMRVHLRKEPADAFSALDVLRTRAAECQGHAFLIAALACALGIPARVANGVVYSEEFSGFLHHAWNESWVGDRWLPVDATLDQAPVDATHVKPMYGEEVQELASLDGWVGKLEIRVPVVE